MATGTVYPAKVALKALLEAHDFTGDNPTIQWGAPTESEEATFDLLYFGDGIEIEDVHLVLGHGRADERYPLRIVVDVQRYGDDEQATEQRMWQLHDGVITVLAANSTLSGTVNRLQDFRVRPGNVPKPSMWRSQVVIEIGVVGFITYP